MKKFLFAVALAFGLFAPQALSAQSEGTQNYFVLNRNLQQLKAISWAAGDLAEMDGEQFGEFNVVICGKAVKDLVNPEIMDPIIKLAEEKGVQLVACGFSLKKFGVDPSAIPAQMTKVDNGILYGFSLQKKGYYSITL